MLCVIGPFHLDLLHQFLAGHGLYQLHRLLRYLLVREFAVYSAGYRLPVHFVVVKVDIVEQFHQLGAP